MHWLQTLDTRLFMFVNRSLANPFFDWLMPVLSGNGGVKGGFLALAVAAGLALLWFGNRRARLFVLMMVLIVATNDGLLCNTLKHAVARPRPFVTLPEARVFGVVARATFRRMKWRPTPAAATACRRRTPRTGSPRRWSRFCFTAKKIRVTLPLLLMALAVSFSRIYNGVHYPSDVLAGAVLGAGYAAAAIIGLEAAWNWIGKKWFPIWHAQMPSLLNAERGVRSAESEFQDASRITHHASRDSIGCDWVMF